MSVHPVAALMCLVVALLPFGRLAELPIVVMALWGVVLLFRQRQQVLSHPAFTGYTAVFMAYFAMVAISAVDSYWSEKSWLIAMGLWRFYFAGVLVLWASQGPRANQFKTQVITSVGILALVWSVDALIQAIWGHNMLGLASYPGRLTGVFGNNVKLGPVLALLLPLVLLRVKTLSIWLRWLLVATVLCVIVLSGTRSAWLMAGFVLLLFWWQHVPGRRWLLLLKSGLLAAVALVVLWFSSPHFQERIERSVHLFSGQEQAIDFALADRLPIWRTAIDVFQAHPINGVGARAFRVVYPDYAPNGGDVGQGLSLHAHHWVLEVMAETGLIGLLVMLGILVTMARMLKGQIKQTDVWPYAVALLAALLPVVSLYSLFSSFWSICLWWMLVMLFAGVRRD